MKNSIIIETTPEELVNLLTSKINEILNTTQVKSNSTKNEYIDIFEAAKLLKLSANTLRKKAQKFEVPCYKIRNRWLFSKQELIEYINSGKQPTLSELLNE